MVPTYAWRIPRLVEQWIRKSDFPSGVKAYFVMTCGDGIGNAPKYVRKLCREKDFVYMGCAQIIMPENYLAMFPVPSEEEACRIIQNSREKLQATAQRIAEGKELKPEKENMACITRCPAKAIEYGKKSLGKPRYRCPYENQNTEYSKNL